MLILKQNAANSVPTPPAGKGTIFLDDSDTLSVKTSDGNVETFPTVAASNTQVVFIDGTALSGEAAFTYNKNTNTLAVDIVAAGNVKTDNLQYANGSPWDLSDPGGSNTQVQFNDDESFGGSAAFTFNKSSNAVTMTGNLTAANVTGGNLVTANFVAGTLTTAAQPNITSVGTLSTLDVSGNAVIGGNLAVNGNVTYVNVDTLQVEDPIIELGGGPNGAPLTTNDGKDRGTLLHYYTTSAIDAFMGWDNSNGEFGFGSNVSVVNDVVTFNSLGNVRVGNIIGNGQALTGLTGANVTGQVGNAAVAGTVYTNAQPNITSVGTLTSLSVTGNGLFGNVYANAGTIGASLLAGALTTAAQPNVTSVGTLTSLTVTGNVSAGNVSGTLLTGTLATAAQPNVTSVGTLTSLKTGTSALSADFPNATSIFAHDNTGVLATDNFGLVGEATGDGANASTTGVGIFGIGKANSGTRGTGVQGFATVTNSADTGAAVGVRGYATTTHSGGYNIGVLGNAAGSGFGNYAFYIQAGNIGSIETDTAWDLNDNSATSLSFNSSGKAGILALTTVDGSEGVSMSGTLAVTGNITATAGIKTDNYYYANGSPVDFQQAGGTNTQIQFNDANGFGGSAAFTFNNSSNVVTISGNLSVANVQATGDVTTQTLTSNGNANVGNLGTAGLITATGNVSGGNLTTAGVVAATGNVSGGNLTTAGVVAATGNVSGGNLTTAGALSVTGNANVGNLGTGGLIVATGNVTGGNINTAGKVVASTLESNVTTGTAPFTVASTTKVTNLNADLLDGFSTATAATANTVVIRDADGSFSANVVTATLSGAATTAGTVTTAAQPNITSVGTLSSLAVTANGTFGNVYANAGTIGALTLKGEGGNISNVTAGNITGQVANALVSGTVYTNAQPNITSVGTLSSLSVTGNGTFGSVYANSGTVGASLLTGTLTTNAQPNITSVGTLSSLSVTGNVAAGNLTTTGILSVTGTGTSSIAGNLDMTSNNITNLAAPVASTDAATKQYVDDIAQGLHVHAPSAAATPDTLANISGGTVTYNNGSSGVGATLTTTGTYTTIDTVNIANVGTRILVKNEANAAHNGIYTYTSSTVLTRATDFDTPAEMAGGDFTFVSGGATYNDTGWVMTDPVTTVGTTNVVFVQFSGAGTYTAGTGLTLTGSVFSVNASQTQVTSVGTLTGLNVNGNITAANITANTGVFTGNGSGLSALAGGNVTGQVANALVAGTVYTAAQPNITSVGTLSSLAVTGNASAGNISTGGALSVTGNANVGNIGATAGVFTSVSGNGSALTALNASNISTGTLDQARLANSTLTLGSTTLTLGATTTTVAGLTSVTSTTFVGALTGAATTAGTVTTAAQPNITSVGTLSSLSVTGNISAGNVSATTFTGALSGAATTAGTVTTAAQPNITSVGTLSGLTVSSTISGSVSGSAATVTTAAQPNITSVGTLTGLTVSGNLVCSAFFDASVNAAVSAAGTAQGNATVIASEINVVSTVASGAGVALPTAVAGVRVTLINTAANTLLVYPATGGAINSLATNAAYSLPAGGRLEYVAVSTTQWYTLNATYG